MNSVVYPRVKLWQGLLLIFCSLLTTVSHAAWWNSSGANQPGQPLPVDEAYRFSYVQQAPDLLLLEWSIDSDGYYLYRDKIELLTDGKVEVLGIEYASGSVEKEDAIYGKSQVYFNNAWAKVRIRRPDGHASDPLIEVKYQGCWEGGICYPPETKPVQLVGVPSTTSIPSVTALSKPTASVTQSPTTPVSLTEFNLTDQTQFSQALAGSSVWLTLALFFAAGLALSFTPCVLPMIPILSSIIIGHQGRATTREALLYSSVYVLFMALTYTLAGVAAGLFGANIQAAFQEPWIIILFSLLFVGFAFSMFGFYQLQMPLALQNHLAKLSRTQQGGRMTGVAVMGVLSALIVGPCVAAPLAGALIYIGQTGDPLLGGAALFSLSLGMGLPLILIGTSAGKLLPKAGHWMDHVKSFFGVILLAMAIWMLDRIVPPVVTLVLLGSLLVISSIYLHALDSLPQHSSGWRKLGKGLGILMLIYGGALLLGAAGGSTSLLQPLQGMFASKAASENQDAVFAEVSSLEELEPILASARQNATPVMLDFYADWCVSCKELEAFLFKDADVQQAFQRYTLVRVDVTANDEFARALYRKYGIIGPPALIQYDSQGIELSERTLIGVPGVDEFVAWLVAVN